MKHLIRLLVLSFLFTGFATDVEAKVKTITGKLYKSANDCLLLKTRAGKKYNLKNAGSLEPQRRVRLQVETLPKGEVVCEGPGTPVSVVKVVKIYKKTYTKVVKRKRAADVIK